MRMKQQIKQILIDLQEKNLQQRNLKLIQDSGLFDNAWYLTKNPDIFEEIQRDPLKHYLQIGGFHGRDPGPLFCSRWYLNSYEDVRESGLNPLVHYLTEGKKKGYQPQSFLMEYVNAAFYSTYDVYPSKYYPYHTKKNKIFCIGHNKTGTTSIEAVLKSFGYKVGLQFEAETFITDWAIRDFRRIIEYCKTADAFQDVPFSLDFTYQTIDRAFPGSKFILSVRNSAEEWYNSLVRFYGKIIGVEANRVPGVDDIKNFYYAGEGWLWRFQKYVYGVNESTLFDKEFYMAYYKKHNAQVIEYFKYRPNDLLVLNVADSSAMKLLCDFLEVKYTGQVMPHLNKSKE